MATKRSREFSTLIKCKTSTCRFFFSQLAQVLRNFSRIAHSSSRLSTQILLCKAKTPY